MNFTISAVIPAYNAERYIKYCLESVRRQTIAPLEVIIVDDGSIDGTYEVANNFIFHNRLDNWQVLKVPNGGPALARDIAIRMAKGSYIALLDADDIWLPEKIEFAREYIQALRLDLIGSHLERFHFAKECELIRPFRSLISNPYCTSTVVFSRAAYLDIGGFDLKQRYSEDYKLWLKFFLVEQTLRPTQEVQRYLPCQCTFKS